MILSMAEKDNFETQSARIRQAVKNLCPNCVVVFDHDKTPNWIKFRVEDAMGTILTSVHPEYLVSEIADWTDQKLQQMIESLTGGRVRAGNR